MYERLKFTVIFICLIIALLVAFPVKDIYGFIRFEIYKKEDLYVSLKKVNPQIEKLTAEPSNTMAFKVSVRSKSGYPVNKALVDVYTDIALGRVEPDTIRTDNKGEATVYYIPPSPEELYSYSGSEQGIDTSMMIGLKIYAKVKRARTFSESSITLIQPPVVFIHGYMASGHAFESLEHYLSSRGFQTGSFNYKSDEGVLKASEKLAVYLDNLQLDYNREGIQVNKFNLVTHSMGGLVARHYSCSPSYVQRDNIFKLIFVAVPHRGSPWASLGQNQYSTKGLEDLVPESRLFIKVFPSLINKGLNSTIQTGSIAGQYDEVVSQASSSLEDWKIKTSVFYIGESNYSMDELLQGTLYRSLNHVNILNNSLVFQKIEEMLVSTLPYPDRK